MLPKYAQCRCGEYRQGALRMVNNVVSCHNCADRRHQLGTCSTCFGFNTSIEWHHLAGKEHSCVTVSLCLNCHGAISARQRDWSRQLATINHNGLTESQAMTFYGAVHLIALSWESASLRTESTWRRVLLVGYGAVAIAQGFLKERFNAD